MFDKPCDIVLSSIVYSQSVHFKLFDNYVIVKSKRAYYVDVVLCGRTRYYEGAHFMTRNYSF